MYYKLNDKNLNLLIWLHYAFKIIYIELHCDIWISCPVNKQNIYLFYIFVINQWITMKLCIKLFRIFKIFIKEKLFII